MTFTAPTLDRAFPDICNPERAALVDWLRFHRETLLLKCAGLTAEQLAVKSTEPSRLTLLGLVRHMAENERWWFQIRAAGLDLDPIYPDVVDDFDPAFDDLARADAEADLAMLRAECSASDDAVADLGLDHTVISPRSGRPMDLRWIYLHMIEEYARHNGHADLIRERIDGMTGD
ncbi:MAG TPA: DinB family protein [Micromonosporaceae bacterium]